MSPRSHQKTPITMLKPRTDFRPIRLAARTAAPIPRRTECSRRFRRCEFRDCPSCTLPDRCAEAAAYRSRGIVRAPPGPEPRRDGAFRRGRTRRALLPELARRFSPATKYPPAFCDLLRARDFQFLFVRQRWLVRIHAGRLPQPSHFFRILRRPSSVRAERLPASPFRFPHWQFRAAAPYRRRWFLRPKFASGIFWRVHATRKLQIRFFCARRRIARAPLLPQLPRRERRSAWLHFREYASGRLPDSRAAKQFRYRSFAVRAAAEWRDARMKFNKENAGEQRSKDREKRSNEVTKKTELRRSVFRYLVTSVFLYE